MSYIYIKLQFCNCNAGASLEFRKFRWKQLFVSSKTGGTQGHFSNLKRALWKFKYVSTTTLYSSKTYLHFYMPTYKSINLQLTLILIRIVWIIKPFVQIIEEEVALTKKHKSGNSKIRDQGDETGWG